MSKAVKVNTDALLDIDHCDDAPGTCSTPAARPGVVIVSPEDGFSVVSTQGDHDEDDHDNDQQQHHDVQEDAIGPIGMTIAGRSGQHQQQQGRDRYRSCRRHQHDAQFHTTTTLSPRNDMNTISTTTCTSTSSTSTSMVPSYYADIPETHDLVWEDDFFEDDMDHENIVAVFDFDYTNMSQYYESVTWTCFGVTSLLAIPPTVLGLSLLMGIPCHINNNVQWSVHCQHVAITKDGIKYVQDKRPTCWGFSCTDAGRRSKIIPIDQITDCDIIEAAGNTCVCIQNKLHVIHLDTAGHAHGKHELTIVGLKNPEGFRKLLLALKREYRPPLSSRVLNTTATSTTTTSIEKIKRVAVGDHQGNIAHLLRDIRHELRKNSDHEERGRRPIRRHRKLTVNGLPSSRNSTSNYKRIRQDYHPAVAKAIAMIDRTTD